MKPPFYFPPILAKLLQRSLPQASKMAQERRWDGFYFEGFTDVKNGPGITEGGQGYSRFTLDRSCYAKRDLVDQCMGIPLQLVRNAESPAPPQAC